MFDQLRALVEALTLPHVLLIVAGAWVLVRLVELVVDAVRGRPRCEHDDEVERLVAGVELLVDVVTDLRDFASDAADERQSVRQTLDGLVDPVDVLVEQARRTTSGVERLVALRGGRVPAQRAGQD
jgi:hypothetical protein